MDEIKEAQVTAQVLMNEGIATAPPEIIELATKVNQQAENNYEQALTLNIPENQKELDDAATQKVVDAIYYDGFGATGAKNYTIDAEARVRLINDNSTALREFIKNGNYSTLPGNITASLELQFRTLIAQSPLLTNLFQSLPPGEQANHLKRMFERQDFRMLLQSNLVDFSGKLPVLPDIDAADIAYKKSEFEYSVQLQKKTAADKDVSDKQTEKAGFDRPDPNDKSTWASLAKERDDLETGLPAEADQKIIEQEYKALSGAFDTAEKAYVAAAAAGKGAMITQAKTALDAARTALIPAEQSYNDLKSNKAKIEHLKDREAKLPAEITEATRTQQTEQTNLDTKDKERISKKNARVTAKQNREILEKKLVQDMLSEPGRKSVGKWLQDEQSRIAVLAKKDVAEKNKEIKDDNQRNVQTHIDHQLTRMVGGKPQFRIDEIVNMTERLMRDGPRTALEYYIDSMPTLSVAERASLKKDSSFMDTMQTKLVDSAMNARAIATLEAYRDNKFGPFKSDDMKKLQFSSSEIALLESKDWGKGKLTAAMNAVDEANKAREDMIQKGLYNFNSFSEWLKYYGGKIPKGKLALILIGLMVAGGLASNMGMIG